MKIENKNLKSILFIGISLFASPYFVSAAVNANSNLTACGQALDDPGRTYVLQNDVSSDGTCFNVSAQHVTLNLNGKTITYDNAAPIVIANDGFESGDATSWETSHAPNASVSAGTFVLPQTLHAGNYGLRFHLTEASSQSPNNQYVRSLTPVTLEANTSYSISAMFRNSGNNDTAENDYHDGGLRDQIVMSVEFEGADINGNAVPGTDSSGNPINVINTKWDTTDVPSIAPDTVLTTINGHKTGVTWRGFQYTNKIFTTGNSPLTAYVVVRVSNVPAGTNGYVYADDIKMTKYGNYGVELARNYVTSHYATVYNGKIVQGQGNGFESHAIMNGELSNYWDFHDLEITTQGVNSKIFSSFYGDTSTDTIPVHSTFHDNVIHHNVDTIKSRDGYDGAAVFVPYHANGASFYNNTFTHGVQTALAITHTDGQPLNEIYNNNITLQTKYTNDFAISAGGANIYGNTVNCGSGNNSCRGIVISGTDTHVHNNTISVQQLPRNQEYNGCQPPGAYAMQGEYTANNAEVDHNIVVANAGSGTTQSGKTVSCNAAGLRLNTDPDQITASINIHNNEFTANSIDAGSDVSTGSGRATTMLLADIVSPLISIHDNIFRANSRWLVVDYAESNAVTMTLSNNKFETVAPLDPVFHPFETGIAAANFTFAGNTYGSLDDKAKFEGEFFRDRFAAVSPGSSITITDIDIIAPSSPGSLDVQ